MRWPNWRNNMQAAEEKMVSWDGAELFYRAWIPAEAKEKALLAVAQLAQQHEGR